VKDGGDRPERGDILELLAGLLAADEPERLEGFHQQRLAGRGVSLADAATARLLLLDIVRSLELGDPDSCERIALALDATLPLVSSEAPATAAAVGRPASATPLERTMPAILAAAGSVDATMPALAPPAPPAAVEVTTEASVPPSPSSAPPTARARRRAPAFDDDPFSVSVDDTVMFGHLQAIDLESATDPAVAGFKVERWAEPDAPGAHSAWRAGTAVAASDEGEDQLTPPLDLDRYAVLCAWAELQPERRADHNRQYGLVDEEARRELEQRFEELFSAEPGLRAELTRRMQLHLAWLRG
jgi:hypothetical protein